jgi:hypothetical protein
MSTDLTTIKKLTNQMAQDTGRALMHSNFPNDFEYYMMALELVAGDGSTIDYLAFPVLPTSIVKSENKRISIKKAFKSTLVLTSTAFTPQDITIRGSFGRGFKILIGGNEVMNGVAFRVSVKNNVFGLSQSGNKNIIMSQPQFNASIKTGYGVTKLLQSIIQKSDGSDSNGPYRLFFYNFALGESYLVVAPSKALTLEQNDKDMNMIWNYTLNLTIIAPLELVKSAKQATSLENMFSNNIIQNTTNQVGKELSGYLSRIKV